MVSFMVANMVSIGTLKKVGNGFKLYFCLLVYLFIEANEERVLVGIGKIGLSFLPISIPRNTCMLGYASVIL